MTSTAYYYTCLRHLMAALCFIVLRFQAAQYFTKLAEDKNKQIASAEKEAGGNREALETQLKRVGGTFTEAQLAAFHQPHSGSTAGSTHPSSSALHDGTYAAR
jgi:hypothetical protein